MLEGPERKSRRKAALRNLLRATPGAHEFVDRIRPGLIESEPEHGGAIHFDPPPDPPLIAAGRSALAVGLGTFRKWLGELDAADRATAEQGLAFALAGLPAFKDTFSREDVEEENAAALKRTDEGASIQYWHAGNVVLIGARHPEEYRLRIEVANHVDPPTGVKQTGLLDLESKGGWRNPVEVIAHDVSEDRRKEFEIEIDRAARRINRNGASVTYK